MENSPGSAPRHCLVTAMDPRIPAGLGELSPAQGVMFAMVWGWKSLQALSVWWDRRWQSCSVSRVTQGAATLPAVPELLGKEGRSCVGSLSQAHSPREGWGRASMAGQNAAPATPNNFPLVTDDSDVLMEESLGWLRLQLAFPSLPGLGCGFRHRDTP